MNALDYLLELPWVQPLGWTLIHFLWQGAVIGTLAAVALRMPSMQTPQVRYLIGLGAVLMCVLAPLVTFTVLAKPFSRQPVRVVVLGNAREVSPPPVERAASPAERGEAPKAEPVLASPPKVLEEVEKEPVVTPIRRWWDTLDVVRWAVVLWFAGVCLLALRLSVAWMRIQVWRSRANAATDEWLEATLKRLTEILSLKTRIPILLSPLVPGPVTLGFFKPVVILPVQMMTGLSREHIEAIVAHELAHIRRHDYLVNLLQSAVEVALFYHPVVWWLNRQVREAREECCDALAVAVCRSRMVYVEALASLAEWQGGELALGARDGELLPRVLQLLGRRTREPLLAGKNAAWFLSLLIAVCAGYGIVFSARLLAAGDPPMANMKQAPRGMVVDEQGMPVSDAEVILYHEKGVWDPDNGVVERVKSNAAGEFVMNAPLEFMTPNGSDRSDHYILFGVVEGRAPASQVVVGGTPDKKEYKLTVTKPVQQTYEVVDREGRPLAGATVWMRHAGEQGNKAPFFSHGFAVREDLGICSAVTDARGRATLTNLPDTTYSVAASMDGWEDSISCTTPKEGVPKFTMLPEAVLEGKVSDPLGQPVAGAVVWLYPKFRWHVYFQAKTDGEGRFRIRKIWSTNDAPDWGKYELGIRHPNFAAATAEVKFTPAQHITGYAIKAEPGVKISGLLLDPADGSPVAGGVVLADTKSGRLKMVTDRAGRFQGRTVAGPVSAFANEPPGGHYYAMNSPFVRGKQIETAATGAKIEFNLVTEGAVGRLGQLSGRILAGESPVSAALVKVAPLENRLQTTPYYSGGWRGVYTDASGSFIAQNVPVGMECAVIAKSPDGKSAGIVQEKLDQNTKELTEPVRLAPTANLRVLFRGSDGQPLANTEIELAPRIEGVKIHSQEQKLRTNESGVVRVPNVLPGLPYLIEVAGKYDTGMEINLTDGNGRPLVNEVLLSDRQRVRLEDGMGGVLKIKSVKEYFVVRMEDGEPMRWSNGKMKILGREGDEVLIPRSMLGTSSGGDLEALIETESGALVRAKGSVPGNPADVVVLKGDATTPSDTMPDETVGAVSADEIVGRVLDPSGRPVVKAKVVLGGSALRSRSFETDEEGVFRIKYDQPWYTYLLVEGEGYAPLFVTDVPIGDGFKVSLQNRTRFRGKVAGDNPGKVSILLEKNKPTKRERMGYEVRDLQQRVETDAEGAYDFPVEPGTYRYKITSADGRFARGTVVVEKDGTASFDVPLQKGHTVVMEVIDWQTGKPVEGVPMSINEKTDVGTMRNKPGGDRTSDKDGLMKWENLMPGETQFLPMALFSSILATSPSPYIRIWREDEPKDWRRIDPKVSLPTGNDGTHGLVIEVEPNMKPLRILVEKGVHVSGTIVGPQGEKLQGINVNVVPNEGRRATLTGDSKFHFQTDGDGRFSGYIPAGNGVVYNLCAFVYPGLPGPEVANAVSESFGSKPGDEIAFNLRMERGGWFAGRVVDKTGTPIPNLKVQTTCTDFHDNPYADRMVKTDASGKFRVGPLRAGEYLIQPDTMEGTNLSRTPPGFTPPSRSVADGEEKDVGDIVFPLEAAERRE